MVSSDTKLLERVLELPDDDHAEKVVRLLDSAGEPDPAIEAAWLEEARHRLSDLQSGRVTAVPWSEARARIFARE